MAINSLSDRFLLSTTIQAGNAAASEPPIPIPDNCHTVIVFNPSTTDVLYAAIGSVGDILDPTGAIAGSIIPISVPASGSVTIGMGTFSDRPNSSLTKVDTLCFQASAGTIQVNINYICSIDT
jgi:hypothetical protein